MKVSQFDKIIVKSVAEELEKAAKDIATKYGLVVEPGSWTYSNIEFSNRIRFRLPSTSGSSASFGDEQNFKRHAEFFGLKPEWLGEEFDIRGTKYKVVGLNIKNPKKAVTVERFDGRRLKCSPDMLIRSMSEKIKAA